MGSRLRIALGILAVALVGIQLVPLDRSNPPVEADFETPADVKQVLRQSCYDCHSNETRWPWYSRVAPFSWLVAWDVSEAREHLNFSSWARLAGRKQREEMDEIWEHVDEGAMPLWYYLPLHPDARLTTEDRNVLRAWTGGGEPGDVD